VAPAQAAASAIHGQARRKRMAAHSSRHEHFFDAAILLPTMNGTAER
jgi:hypothetical protein